MEWRRHADAQMGRLLHSAGLLRKMELSIVKLAGKDSEMNAREIIDRLKLEPLPIEGGYFRETYRSTERLPAGVLPPRYGGERCFCTAIFYLLTPETVSAMHRVRSDEVFHFYLGDPVTMLQLEPGGGAQTILLGQDVQAGQQLQVVVPAGVWQGAFLNEGGSFALMGCTVAPGFEFSDFQPAARADLLREFPGEAALIERLTREE